jgi:CHAT domain-containing protein
MTQSTEPVLDRTRRWLLVSVTLLAMAMSSAVVAPAPADEEVAPDRAALNAAIDKAKTHRKAALDLYKEGKLNEAAKAGGEAVSVLLDLPAAREDAGAVSLLSSLGMLCYATRNLQAARSAWEAVLAHREKTLPPDHPDLRTAQRDLCVVLTEFGELRAARKLGEEVLASCVRSLSDNHRETQKARFTLAPVLIQLGDLEGARSLQEKVLEVWSRTLPSDNLDVQMARLNLADTLRTLGDLERSRSLNEAALAALAPAPQEQNPTVKALRIDVELTLKGNLSLTLEMLGDLPRALPLRQEVLDARLRALPEDHSDVQLARSSLGVILYRLGDVEVARSLHEQALEVWSRTLPLDHYLVQFARNNLSSALLAAGETEAAKALQEKSLSALAAAVEPDQPHLQTLRLNLATTLRTSGDLKGARSLEESALASLSRSVGPNHVETLRARFHLSCTLRELGELEAARALEDEVLAAFRRTLPAGHPYRLAAQAAHAATLLGLGDGVATCATLKELASGIEAQASDVGSGLSPRHLEGLAAVSRRHLDQFLSLTSASGAAPCRDSLAPEGFRLVEELRGVGVAALRRLRLMERWSSDREVTQRLHEARVARGRLSYLADKGRRGKLEAADADSAASATLQRDRAESALRARVEALGGASLSEREVDPKAIGAALPGEAVAVGYWTYTPPVDADPRGKGRGSQTLLLAHVVESSGAVERIELGPLSSVEAAVDAWRRAAAPMADRSLSRPRKTTATSEGEVRRLGEELRRIVVDPLLPKLSHAQRWIVAADGPLHLVALDALPYGDGLVGDRWTVELRTTLSELPAANAPAPKEGSLLAIGGADFDAAPAADPVGSQLNAGLVALASPAAQSPATLRGGHTRFAPLPASVREVEAILGLFGGEAKGAVSLSGAAASKAAFLARASEARFLHLATHAYFAPETVTSLGEMHAIDPEFSLVRRSAASEELRGLAPSVLCGLAFAGANLPPASPSADSSILTAEELALVDLSRCELAVLSACETSVGVRRAGQGLASLERALAMAGVRASLTSLWAVPDDATRELMVEFYRRFRVLKEPKGKALWEAKMSLRRQKNPDGSTKHPFGAWAGWVLVGEQR